MGWFLNHTYKMAAKSFIGNYKVLKNKYPNLSKRELYLKAIEYKVGERWKMADEKTVVYKNKIPLEVLEKDTFKDVVEQAVIIELAKGFTGGGKSLLEHDDSVKDIKKFVKKELEDFKE